MSRGELPYREFYTVLDIPSTQQGRGDIKLITPTQLAVEQGKMAIQRKLELLPAEERKVFKKVKKSMDRNLNFD